MNIIVAASENNAIGYQGNMPWHLSADLKYFRQTTMGHAVIMGRKTYESIGRPLPGRHNIVITRDPAFSISDEVLQSMKEGTSVQICNSIEEALEAAPADAFVIGGAQIYNRLWSEADAIYLTRVHINIDTFDAAVPPIPAGYTQEIVGQQEADEKNDYPVTFEVWRKTV